jgi:large subunit ribosomal protein L6
MSRIGLKPVEIPAGVQVSVNGKQVAVKGPKGSLSHVVPDAITVEVKDGRIVVGRTGNERLERSLHGLTRSLLANMVLGVTQGYEKGLEIHGVGFSAKPQGRKLVLELGFSHPVELALPDGIEVDVKQATNPALFTFRGADKQLVGQLAATIRHLRPVEPYKGKGVRYMNEQIRRKAGKTFTSAG